MIEMKSQAKKDVANVAVPNISNSEDFNVKQTNHCSNVPEHSILSTYIKLYLCVSHICMSTKISSVETGFVCQLNQVCTVIGMGLVIYLGKASKKTH